jgi:flagellar basal-body rod modification protein FlgD
VKAVVTSPTSRAGYVGDDPTVLQNASSVEDALDPTKQKDMFLKLLVAQLKNQDPTSPMDQKDMMGQMAQFSTVEQLANVAKGIAAMQSNATFAQSVSLIGKTVDYMDPEGNVISGKTVTAVTATGGVSKLVLDDGKTVEPGDVIKVSS